MGENDTFDVKKLGIKNCYKFPGFCNKHDSEIFELIETHPIDFSNPRSLQLFAYRTVCLEYRKKEIYLDLVKSKLEVLRENFPDKHHYVDFKPAEIALKDVKFYKNEFEEDLEQKIKTKFDLEIIELPLRKICFSSTLSIHDAGNEHTFEYDKYGHERIEPLASSVLNYFPYNGKSFLVAAMHKKYYCNWTKDLIQKLRDKCDIDKIISDLLTYRLELWGIAPEIFENIPQEKIEKFKLDSHLYRDNYEYSIDTEFNLFA